MTTGQTTGSGDSLKLMAAFLSLPSSNSASSSSRRLLFPRREILELLAYTDLFFTSPFFFLIIISYDQGNLNICQLSSPLKMLEQLQPPYLLAPPGGASSGLIRTPLGGHQLPTRSSMYGPPVQLLPNFFTFKLVENQVNAKKK